MLLSKKKLCVVMPALERGGAERVVLTILNNIDLDIFDVKLLVIENRGNYLEELRPEIQLDTLNIKRVSKSIFPLVRYLRKHKPNVVFSSLSHMNLILTLVKPFIPSNIKLIVRETSIPSIHNANFKFKSLVALLYRWGYNRVDKVICQCQYMKSDLHENFGIKNSQMTVINNPVDAENIYSKLTDSNCDNTQKKKVNLIAVGSIEELKQYDHLLVALSKLNNTDWQCTILGSGSKLDDMKSLCKQLKIEGQVSFLGRVNNPYPYINESDALILTSKYEGFPNGVLEAITLGVPVLAYDCPGGIREIIVDGLNGKLIPMGDTDMLAQQISKLDKNEFDKEKIAQLALKKFNSKYILNKYQEILMS